MDVEEQIHQLFFHGLLPETFGSGCHVLHRVGSRQLQIVDHKLLGLASMVLQKGRKVVHFRGQVYLDRNDFPRKQGSARGEVSVADDRAPVIRGRVDAENLPIIEVLSVNGQLDHFPSLSLRHIVLLHSQIVLDSVFIEEAAALVELAENGPHLVSVAIEAENDLKTVWAGQSTRLLD